VNDKLEEMLKALSGAVGEPIKESTEPFLETNECRVATDLLMRQHVPNFSYVPGYRGDLPFPWLEEDWISFDWASDEISRRLGLSKGLAQTTLRELCGKGVIRVIRYGMVFVGDKLEALDIPAQDVLPSEWLKDQVDLVDDNRFPDDYWIAIDVNKADFEHWLVRQAQPKTRADGKSKSRKSPKRDLVREAIKSLWNGAMPKEMPNGLIEQQVGVWITSYCKGNNIPKPDISGATILRIAGRK
jgi:hypothetical protein